ncbi:MAG: MBL fold metallo-hydrolase [Verrucomicrobia bacterium]|nr:MBL fold metallo-hydrolase [Verrucomicrobiota bacterium]
MAKPAPQVWGSEAALKQLNLNKLSDASGPKDADVRRSQKPTFAFICVYAKDMKLTFLGTRGEIDPKTKRHRMHTALLITYQRKKVMIDCGTSWLHKVKQIKPDHIVLTHAHPDHCWGLKKGAPCPVWATRETWKLIQHFSITDRRLLAHRKRKKIAGISFEPFPVWHSIRAPAVGYRILCGPLKFFYVPDVTWIPQIDRAFRDIDFYIGDGATIVHPMIRKHEPSGQIFGHATVRQQLTWCRKQKVPKMIVTHCGAAIVRNEKRAIHHIQQLAHERGVKVQIAYDGLELIV